MKIVKEGYPFIAVPAVVGLLLVFALAQFSVVFSILGWISIFAALFCVYFFRDPYINITEGENLIISPCNGKVLEVKRDDKEICIRVFLSVFDVHLQRTPVSGTVTSVEHKAGKFLKAMEPEAHIVNEQNIITIENETGVYVVKQIAGILARRCVAWVKPGDVLKTGDKIGVIKFSSQVDLHMKPNAEVKVKVGDRVVSGITVLAELNK
jgi:phosphatidylserine decarboxylase